MSDDTITAIAMARLRALRTHLLPLHRALIEHERRDYERIHGVIGGPHDVLMVVMQHPWFAWLRTLSALIVQVDERLADDARVKPEEVEAFAAQTRQLLYADDGSGGFYERYRNALQSSPDVVVAHGRVAAWISELKGPDAGDARQ